MLGRFYQFVQEEEAGENDAHLDRRDEINENGEKKVLKRTAMSDLGLLKSLAKWRHSLML